MPHKENRKKPLTQRQAVLGFIANRRPTLLGIKHLMKAIEKMVVPAKTSADILKGYQMSPEEMIKTGKIPVIFQKKNEPIYGCYQMSSILYTALKELGMRPKMTRYFISSGTPHTTVIFRLNGKLYEADPFYGSQIIKVDEVRLKQIRELNKMKKFKFIKPESYTKAMYDYERKTGELAK